MHNRHNNHCGCGHSNHTKSFGVIDYSAQSINDLLAIIPLKANREEVPAPDEEDLAIEEGLLKLKDKKYNHDNYSGLGRCYLRKNMVDGVNVLTQGMFFNTDGSPKKNTRYIIQYDYVLNYETLQIPEGCELSFEGGSIKNGTIVLNETLVRPLGCRIEDYISAKIEGSYKKGQLLYSNEYEQTMVWTGSKWKYSYSPSFRWSVSADPNVSKIQISRDEGKTWSDLSNDLSNGLHIKKYIGQDEVLPTSGIAEGTIYAKGPYYKPEDTSNQNPIYRLWVYAWKGDTLAWQDNGEFQSIAAGIVQESGDSKNVVMSQKATTEKLFDLASEEMSFKLLYNENVEVTVPSNIVTSKDVLRLSLISGETYLFNVTAIGGSFSAAGISLLDESGKSVYYAGINDTNEFSFNYKAVTDCVVVLRFSVYGSSTTFADKAKFVVTNDSMSVKEMSILNKDKIESVEKTISNYQDVDIVSHTTSIQTTGLDVAITNTEELNIGTGRVLAKYSVKKGLALNYNLNLNTSYSSDIGFSVIRISDNQKILDRPILAGESGTTFSYTHTENEEVYARLFVYGGTDVSNFQKIDFSIKPAIGGIEDLFNVSGKTSSEHLTSELMNKGIVAYDGKIWGAAQSAEDIGWRTEPIFVGKGSRLLIMAFGNPNYAIVSKYDAQSGVYTPLVLGRNSAWENYVYDVEEDGELIFSSAFKDSNMFNVDVFNCDLLSVISDVKSDVKSTSKGLEEASRAIESKANTKFVEDEVRKLQNQINDIPQGGGGSGTGSANVDNEDLTEVNGYIKLKNRKYSLGRGYKVLRRTKYAVEGYTTEKDSEWADWDWLQQIDSSNTTYEVRYDLDLNGKTLSIPEGCVLYFNGGSISNGTITGVKTEVVATNYVIFKNITLQGTWNNSFVSSEWFDFGKSKRTDDRRNLSNLMVLSNGDVFTDVYISTGDYYASCEHNGGCMVVPSNTYIHNCGNLHKMYDNVDNYRFIKLSKVDNVTIEGGSLTGDIESHSSGDFGNGDHQHGIQISGCTNVKVKNIAISKFWGDGIDLIDAKDGDKWTVDCKFITIESVSSQYNGRQGLSVESGHHVRVVNSDFSYNGTIINTAPGLGIDIEPWNTETDKIEDVCIDNCSILGNNGENNGLDIGVFSNFTGNQNWGESDDAYNQGHFNFVNIRNSNIGKAKVKYSNGVAFFGCRLESVSQDKTALDLYFDEYTKMKSGIE